MAFGDVLSSLSSRFSSSGGHTPTMSEKPSRRVSWRKLFGFEQDQATATRETAWLDGLRGVAAFLVMTYHFHLAWFNPFSLEAPFGANEDSWDPWRLPFLRLWMCSGHAQVSVFFVLSGFVLSWSTLASIRAGRYDKIAQSLGSAVFRRWLRLYLPCFAVAFWYMLIFYFGIIDIGGLTGILERKTNIFAQFLHWLRANQKWSNPFDIDRNQWSALNDYEATMWTIPFEFAGSLLVFIVLIGVCRIRDYTRRSIITVGVTFYAAAIGRWSYWLFAAGVVIADYVRERGGFRAIAENQSRRVTIMWSAVFVFGLYLAGFPEPHKDAWPSPGYELFTWLIPTAWKDIEGGGRFWWCWAGILIILSASHLTGVQRVFDNSVARYLGRISYMLYLMHRNVLDLVGKPLKAWVLPIFGRKDLLELPAGPGLSHKLVSLMVYAVLMGILAPLALFVAHWVSVFVDEPSVRFAKWVEDRFINGTNPAPKANGIRGPPAEESAHLLPAETEMLPTHNGTAASRYPA